MDNGYLLTVMGNGQLLENNIPGNRKRTGCAVWMELDSAAPENEPNLLKKDDVTMTS